MVPRIMHPAAMPDRRSARNWLVIAAAVLGVGAGWTGASMGHDQGGATSSSDDRSIEATIAELRARPQAFAGKKVRLTGQLTECYLWECSLCPEGMTSKTVEADRCVALGFKPLIDNTGFGSEEQEAVFRFSSVTLTATFDPSCWTGPCLDRQVVLKDAIVDTVTQRRAGALGLWVNPPTAIASIGGETGARLERAGIDAGYPDTVPIRAFTTAGQEPIVVVCWSPSVIEENDPGKWPATLESALFARSTLDFFRCSRVREIDGRFVLQTEL